MHKLIRPILYLLCRHLPAGAAKNKPRIRHNAVRCKDIALIRNSCEQPAFYISSTKNTAEIYCPTYNTNQCADYKISALLPTGFDNPISLPSFSCGKKLSPDRSTHAPRPDADEYVRSNPDQYRPKKTKSPGRCNK